MGNLTRCPAVIGDNDVAVPALALDLGVPHLARRVALHPHEDGGDVQAHVDGDDDEPDAPADGRHLGQAQQGNGEARLAPRGAPDGPEARHGHDEEQLRVVGSVDVHVVRVLAEAHGRRDGAEDAGNQNGDLELVEGVS